MKIRTQKTIAIAHFVNKANEDSPCRRLHGHNIGITIEIEGSIKDDGMIVDFRILKQKINELDHKTLIPESLERTDEGKNYKFNTGYSTLSLPKNDVLLIDIPVITAEYLAEYLCIELKKLLNKDEFIKITVYESSESYAQMEL